MTRTMKELNRKLSSGDAVSAYKLARQAGYEPVFCEDSDGETGMRTPRFLGFVRKNPESTNQKLQNLLHEVDAYLAAHYAPAE